MDTQNLRKYFIGFLAFCVLSSKHIIIYNEETLVALCFFLFVFFVAHYFGPTITESLNERSEIIQQELQNFLNIKDQTLLELQSEHRKVTELPQGFQKLAQFARHELQHFHSETYRALINTFLHQINEKAKTVSFSKLLLQQNLQDIRSRNILSNVLLAYKKKGAPNLQQTIDEAIQRLLSAKS